MLMREMLAMILRNRTFFASLLLWASVSLPLAAQDNPVVVELFTSQGCSSCPPADALLHDLADREDVIALALHVDYWDYIGWKDAFAQPLHSERQRTYAINAKRRSVYTPQMIVNGQDSIVGTKAMKIADTIRAHSARPSPISVTVARNAGSLEINAQNSGSARAMVVHVVRYEPSRKVQITRGENAGKYMHYANVVQDMRVIGDWDGRNTLALETPVAGDLPVVVLVQAADQGAILAARRLE